MRILVTGGTGFVGAHTIASLVGAGHTVKMLVRNPNRIAPALRPLGVQGIDHIIGDVTDAASVTEALNGCDAVVHAAAMVTFDRASALQVAKVNVEGTRNVLSLAHERGLDPIIHVSSISALHPPDGPVLTPNSRVEAGNEVYTGTKAGGELVARALQDAGAPVTITYPGGVWGPDDPHFGEQARGVMWMTRLRVLPGTTGGYCVIDVRDVAAVHLAALDPGLGPRRYMVGGHFFTAKQLIALFTRVTGRRAVTVPSPAWGVRAVGCLGDQANRLLRHPLPFTTEGMATLVRSVPTDDSLTHTELGVHYRDPAETVADTLRSLRRQGKVSAKMIGVLAET